MPDAELGAWLRLSLVPGLGGQGLRKLLADFGLPSQVLGAGRAALLPDRVTKAVVSAGMGEVGVWAKPDDFESTDRQMLNLAPKHPAADTRVDAHRDPAATSEASLLYETAHALRSEGDSARAARTLDDYFKRYPHGALQEEALALAIDVAVARGDARSKSLASRYLAEYPAGHFRAKAERALGVAASP